MINYISSIRWTRAAALAALCLAALVNLTEAEAEPSKSQQANDKFKEVKLMRPHMDTEQIQEAYYSDGWSPHSLEPTFTDQEQGDEMVALAAEPQPYVTRVLANNKTIHQVVAPPSSAETPRRQSGKEPGKRAGVQPQQEYYSDEYGPEEESDQTRLGVNDYGSVPYAFERKEIKHQLPPVHMQTLPGLSKNLNSRDEVAPGTHLNYDKANGWLPSKKDPVVSSVQPEQLQPQQQQQQQPDKDLEPKQQQLASIFSGRDSLKAFGKTDAAIEYLRNVLHMKQSQLNSNNSTRPVLPAVGALPTALNQTRANSKQESLQRLSLFASRLTQLLNNVTASQAVTTSAQKPIATSPKPAIDPTEFKTEQAKQQQQQQQQRQQVQTVASAIHPQPLANDFHNYEYDQPQVDTPSGTPVGGDYIESQDEFLRGSSSFLQSAQMLPEAVALDQSASSSSKDYLTQDDNSQTYQSYAPDSHTKPQEPKQEIRGMQLPPLQATSSRYFRMAQPQPTAAQPVHLSPRIPLNYQQQHLEPRQTIPYHAPENKKLSPYTAHRNESEQQFAHRPSGKSQLSPLEPSKRPSQSKIYGYDQQPQPDREHYLPKSPKIVSYNYFESPNEGAGRDTLATNFKLGDALYSSTGSLEHMLSNAELEAIQNQFVSSEHPVVGVDNQHDYGDAPETTGDSHLASLLDGLRSDPLRSEGSDKKPVTVAAQNISAVSDFTRDLADLRQKGVPQAVLPLHLDSTTSSSTVKSSAHKKHSKKDENHTEPKKNLIVYLNHPRPNDMSGSRSAKTETDQYVAAKEFDSQGISKDNKYLDVADLNDYGELKGLQDKNKDGLSVVVIGDAYKYKKIVLLISSKAGGLKFIPMVKDNRK